MMNIERAIKDAHNWLNSIINRREELTIEQFEYNIAQVGLRLWVQVLILGLKRSGYSHSQIAKEITAMGQSCTGATVGRWLKGNISPKAKRFTILERLHSEKVKKGKAA